MQGLGFRDWGSGFRVQGSGFGVWGLGFRVEGRGKYLSDRFVKRTNAEPVKALVVLSFIMNTCASVSGSGSRFSVFRSAFRVSSLGRFVLHHEHLHQGLGFGFSVFGFRVYVQGFRPWSSCPSS